MGYRPRTAYVSYLGAYKLLWGCWATIAICLRQTCGFLSPIKVEWMQDEYGIGVPEMSVGNSGQVVRVAALPHWPCHLSLSQVLCDG